MKLRVLVGLCLLVLSAAIPATAQTIYGCVDNSKGTLRVVAGPGGCDSKESSISWNAVGPAGTPGQDGRDGRDGLNCEPAAPPGPQQVGTLQFDPADIPGVFPIYQFGGGISNTVDLSGGGGAGKAELSPVVILKKTDASSAELFLSCASGQHLKKATITLQAAPGHSQMVELENVLIGGLSLTQMGGSQDNFDAVSLHFARIRLTIDGAKSCWDVVLNKKC